MLFLNNSALATDPGMTSQAEAATVCHWNLWRIRQHPFNQIVEGSPVILVDSWPNGSRLTWEGKAVDLLTQRYETKAEAVRMIAKHFQLTPKDVRSNSYTKEGPETGYIIAWRFAPVRPVHAPRPADMKIGRNGWLLEGDATVLAGWGIAMPKQPTSVRRSQIVTGASRGQGRLSLAERVVVEQHAVTRAVAWCKNEGWPIVDDVSSRKAWDLEARTTKGEPPHFVEVKGTTGRKPVIGVTVAEVNHALANPATTVLVVVTDIKLERLGTPRASGGTLRAYNPWNLLPSELKALTYSWSRP